MNSRRGSTTSPISVEKMRSAATASSRVTWRSVRVSGFMKPIATLMKPLTGFAWRGMAKVYAQSLIATLATVAPLLAVYRWVASPETVGFMLLSVSAAAGVLAWLTVVYAVRHPVRREIARLSISKLIQDGRIHPGRIEELVAKAKAEVDTTVRQAGEAAAYETGIPGLPPEIIKTLWAGRADLGNDNPFAPIFPSTVDFRLYGSIATIRPLP